MRFAQIWPVTRADGGLLPTDLRLVRDALILLLAIWMAMDSETTPFTCWQEKVQPNSGNV